MVKLLDHILSKMAMLCSDDSIVSKLIKTDMAKSKAADNQPSSDSQLKKQNEQKADKMKKK